MTTTDGLDAGEIALVKALFPRNGDTLDDFDVVATLPDCTVLSDRDGHVWTVHSRRDPALPRFLCRGGKANPILLDTNEESAKAFGGIAPVTILYIRPPQPPTP